MKRLFSILWNWKAFGIFTLVMIPIMVLVEINLQKGASTLILVLWEFVLFVNILFALLRALKRGTWDKFQLHRQIERSHDMTSTQEESDGVVEAWLESWPLVAQQLGQPFVYEVENTGIALTSAALRVATRGRGRIARAGSMGYDMFTEPTSTVVLEQKKFEVDDYGFTVLFSLSDVSIKDLTSSAERVSELMNGLPVVVEDKSAEHLAGWRIKFRDATSDKFALTEGYNSIDEDGYLQIGIHDTGEPARIKMSGNPGIVIAGVPGSGKSVLMYSILASVAKDPRVAMAIFDGKGGGDFEPFKERASLYVEDGEALETVRDGLQKLVQEMSNRQKQLREWQVKNIWDEGISPEMPAMFIVIDECQEFYDTTGADKESKQVMMECQKLATKLVKKGRSVGMVVFNLTQKPDSQAIPTALRDVSSIRIAFRLKNRVNEDMILGERHELQEDSPVTLTPEDVGVGYITGDMFWEKFRNPFVNTDSEEFEQYIAAQVAKIIPELQAFRPEKELVSNEEE